MFGTVIAFGMAIMSTGQGDRRGPDISLLCYGRGDRPAAETYTTYMRGRRGRPRFGTTTYMTRRDFRAAVEVEIDGDQGRIHLTGRLIPAIHSGGRDGWWDLENLDFSRGQIRARYRVNGLNRPRVTIDRRNNTISIDGIEDFYGECNEAPDDYYYDDRDR